MWEKVGLDVVHLPRDNGKNFFVMARDDLSGWPEGRALAKADAASIAKFIWEDIVCRHGIFGKLVIDGGPENKAVVEEFTRRYGIKRVQISAYNSKGNGMIERGHKAIIEGLAKLTGGGLKGWTRRFHSVLLSVRTTVHTPTGVTPFYLLYGREVILPLETRYPTWRLLDWNNVKNRSDLLALRARQLELRNDDMAEIVLRKRRLREMGKELFDRTHQIRQGDIKVHDIVLVFDVRNSIDKSSNSKLNYRWAGPYRVKTAETTKGYYTLEELDGTPLKGTFAGNRLKVYYQRALGFITSTPPHANSDESSSEAESEESDESSEYEDDSA